MKRLAACFAVWLSLVHLVDAAASQRGADKDLDENDKKRFNMTIAQSANHKVAIAKMRRQLLLDDFVPLSCNAGLDACISWTSVFGDAAEFPDRVIVDCGTCITMDHPGPELTLLQGIDIQGKLVFEEGYAITLRTASITVQGELEMLSTEPINGSPKIHIIMIGTESQSFTPIGENAAICSGDCAVDRKAITVAGGKVNIHGCNSETVTWLQLYDVAGGTYNNPTSIIVEASVEGQWLPGAELLITAHTRVWNDHQVRRIVSVTDAQTGYVQLDLDAAIWRPTTIVESLDFAVEVALLSRNIVFEGGTNLQDGGHFWIMHTPSVAQTIEGIDIQHFGIQGTLGRYPIHFHFSGDVSGSVVAKNTIRHSHQRCVVVHGTDNVMVEDNVAYDNFGHCYILENGIETGVSFFRNLGAQIDAPATLLPGNDETDDEPAIFWITNPMNYLQGNVAAGSSGSGFWYELKKRGPLKNLFPDPMYEPLGLFDSNVAHSCTGRKGAVRLYPPGYLPSGNIEVIFTGLKAYRNAGAGVFIHKVHNFELAGALLSDNDLGADLDRAEAINVSDTTIIGMSDSYSNLMGRESGTENICSRQGRVIGLDLHSWRLRNVEGGFDINGVDILRFGGIDCSNSWAIRMDSFTLKQGAFEVYTSFSNMFVEDGAAFIDFCTAQASGILDSVYLMDLDGSLAPQSVSTSGPGALVSNGPKMLTFVDPDQCTEIVQGCYQYCRETCFQSIRYEVDPAGTENYKLKVCVRGGPATACIETTWSKRYNGNNPYEDVPRTFLVHLPSGTYDAVFLDESGSEAWPSYVNRHDEIALCVASVDIAIIAPTTTASDCSELIRNGNADMSSSDPLFWLSVYGGLEVVQESGVSSTNAFAGTRFGNVKFLQYIDTRCLTEGAAFSVTARVKLLTESGDVSVCNPFFERCPYLRIYVEGRGNSEIAEASNGADGDGYQSIEGTLEVDATMATSDFIYIFVDWIEKSAIVTRKVFVDNVSVAQIGVPAAVPSIAPILSPSFFPSPSPSAPPSPTPSINPTFFPSPSPSAPPSPTPIVNPTFFPSPSPSAPPSPTPIVNPTFLPSPSPSAPPSPTPSVDPTFLPSPSPIALPSSTPTASPSATPPGPPSAPLPPPCQVEYILFNANTNQPVGLLINQLHNDGRYCIPDYAVNIQVRATSACSVTESAFMTLDGPAPTSRKENVEPYTLFGDNAGTGDIYGGVLFPGHYTITSDLYESNNLKGDLVVSGSLEFEATESCGCEVKYILWDADATVAVGDLKENECSRSNLFSIEARPSLDCPVTESANVTLVGPIIASRYENEVPYTIFGDRQGGFTGRAYEDGSYTIRSEIFSEDDLLGALVAQRDFVFTVSSNCNRKK